MHHLADGIWKATVTIEKVLNHKKKFLKSGNENEKLPQLSSYIDTVWRLTDLEAIKDLTIHERRSEILFPPLMLCLSLLMENFDELDSEDKIKVIDLVKRGTELW